ncbi:sulfite exporter TauE/SafE family protein [Sulfobacillus thermosulfidooxidans]|uniref:sulfite exporter TauE/SafE family protein n=1 Tax=Sulfobacillus thermosulfidooxidans TaxID=28034 RepID=UPI0006B6193C|nr:sulfite exporter TauE/SafE family protein [Sulfobacillus thermosulfidooxidans]
MLSGAIIASVLAFSTGLGIGFLLAAAGGGTLILSIIVLHYLFGLTHAELFGTVAALTFVLTVALFLVRRDAHRGAIRPALWFTVPGLFTMTITKLIPHDLTTHIRLALIGLLLVINTLLSLIISKFLARTRKIHRKRLAMLGGGVGFLAGYFGVNGVFLALPSMLMSGLPQNIAVSSSTLTIASFALTTAIRNMVRASIDWRVLIPFLLGSLTGLMISRVWFHFRQPSSRTGWITTVIVLAAGLFLLQQNWFGLYTPSLALYDGIKGGLWNEFTN